jgi:hypothetical protein
LQHWRPQFSREDVEVWYRSNLAVRSGCGNDCFRRILVVAARSGEGLLTICLQTSIIVQCKSVFVVFATYALASLLKGQLDGGEGDEGDQSVA